MNAFHRNAIQVIAQLGDVLRNSRIFVADADGVVVAASNPADAGRIHADARKVVAGGLDSLISYDNDAPPGMRMSLTLPVEQEGLPVGAIGIAGDASNVMRYGDIAKKVAEFLLAETDASEKKRVREVMKYRFMEQWLTQGGIAKSGDFVKWGESLGLDVRAARRVLIVGVGEMGAFAPEPAEAIKEVVEAVAHCEPGGIVTHMHGHIVCCLQSRSDSMMREAAQRIQQQVGLRAKYTLAVGIDEKSPDMAEAYARARKAFMCALRSGGRKIVSYNEIDVDIFIHDIPDEIKKEYVSKIYKLCTEEEVAEFTTILKSYIKHNGSIQNVASELFMHKNTVQYKIKKIALVTGYDMRHIKDAAALYIASLFHSDPDLL